MPLSTIFDIGFRSLCDSMVFFSRFNRSLSVFLPCIFCPLSYLFFFDLRLLIITLISSNFQQRMEITFHNSSVIVGLVLSDFLDPTQLLTQTRLRLSYVKVIATNKYLDFYVSSSNVLHMIIHNCLMRVMISHEIYCPMISRVTKLFTHYWKVIASMHEVYCPIISRVTKLFTLLNA